MKTIYFSIHADANLIFSESPKSLQSHKVVDYIPGSAVWGALASRLYQSDNYDEQQLWELLQNEHLQVLNGYKAVKQNSLDLRSLPVPLSWNKNKYACQKDFHRIYNTTKAWPDINPFQPKQQRGGYVGGQQIIDITTETTVKTAIDFTTKAAKEGHLYGYQSIAKEQCFIMPLRVDDNYICSDLQTRIIRHLTAITHLGRSRSGEFGQVSITQLPAPVKIPVNVNVESKDTVIWCTSDIYLPNGLDPIAPFKFCGISSLDNVQIDWSRSAVQRKQIRLYNRKRAGFDSVLDVLTKGSVLVLTQPIPHDTAQLLQAHGLGRKRQLGLGEVVVNPVWSQFAELDLQLQISQDNTSKTLVFSGIDFPEAPGFAATTTNEVLPIVDSIFITRLREKQARDEIVVGVNSTLLFDIATFIQSARQQSADVLPNVAFGPSPSQWRKIVRHCERFKGNQKKMFTGLFAQVDPVINHKIKDWQICLKDGTTLINHLELLWQNHSVATIQKVAKTLAQFDTSNNNGLHRLTQFNQQHVS